MKTSLTKLFLATLFTILTSCAHYHRQSYYPSSYQYPAYGNGYVIEQGRYYGGYGYPYGYRYNTYNYYDYRDYDNDYNNHHHNRYDHNQGHHHPRPKPMPMPVVPGGLKQYPPDDLKMLRFRSRQNWSTKQPRYGTPELKQIEPNPRNFNNGKSDVYFGGDGQGTRLKRHYDQDMVYRHRNNFRQ